MHITHSPQKSTHPTVTAREDSLRLGLAPINPHSGLWGAT